MELTTVKELFSDREKYLDKEVQVGGWIRSIRDSKAFGFIVLNDGTCFDTLQIVYHDTMEKLCGGFQIKRRRGYYRKGNPGGDAGGKAAPLRSRRIVLVEGVSNADYPLQKKRHSFEYLRTISHLRPRTNTFQAVFRVRSLDRLCDP